MTKFEIDKYENKDLYSKNQNYRLAKHIVRPNKGHIWDSELGFF